jgi:polysaccharide deacetylase family protein (PEP-CTERM system associated)
MQSSTQGTAAAEARIALQNGTLGRESPFEVSRPWKSAAGAALPNALTCDVEDYFHVGAFEKVIAKSRWNELECRVPRNIDRVLQLLADAGVHGTFFTLGWVAQHFPKTVRRIADEGHEIACHSMNHARAWTLQPEEFQQDVVTAKRILEDVSGTAVRGYRAPSWSLDARTPWAHRVLAEAGYEYSSSVYPVTHDHYGVPNAPPTPFYVAPAGILEVPASTVRFGGRNWPVSGGGFFRLLPLGISLWLLRRARESLGVPVMFYFHPWEIDPEQPRVAGASSKSRFRHYVNLHKTEKRLRVLLNEMSWGRMDRIFCDLPTRMAE